MSHYRTIQALGTPHVIHQGLIDFLDDFELAVMLGHLLYWSDKTDNPLGIYRSNAEWFELFRFKDEKVKKLSDELQKRKLITKTHKRLEHRMFYLFNADEFDRQYEAFLRIGETQNDGLPNPEKPHSPIPKNRIRETQKIGLAEGENSDSFTKITTKNTNKDYSKESEYAPTPPTNQKTKKSKTTDETFDAVKFLQDNGVDTDTAVAFVSYKKSKLKKGESITKTMLVLIQNQAKKTELITFADALKIVMATGKWKSFEADWNWQAWYEAVLISENRLIPDWLNAPKPQNNTFGNQHHANGYDNHAEMAIEVPPTPSDLTNTFNVGGFWMPCFDGYNAMECIAILKNYRLVGETSMEAYKRIKSAGVENCQPHQKANPEFVHNLLNRPKTNGVK